MQVGMLSRPEQPHQFPISVRLAICINTPYAIICRNLKYWGDFETLRVFCKFSDTLKG